jgi:lipoprotein-releasing system permease protein
MSAYELLIGRRYLRANAGNRFLSVISLISMAGVAIGVAVLIVVLSVMNGFERELRSRILSLTSHATISAVNEGLVDWQRLQERAKENAEVVSSAPYIEDQAMLINGKQNSGALVRGVLPAEEKNVSVIDQHLQQGSFAALVPGRFGIVLGAELAKTLKVKVGDRVVMVIPQGTVTPAGVVPRLKRFEVVGVFAIGMYEYDRNLAYIQMGDAQRLYRMGETVTGLRVQLKDLFEAPQVVQTLAKDLGGGFYLDDWTRRHANFFRSIQLTKSMLFLILVLVVAVAAFNIIATLVMVVKEKRSDIAILRTIGATPNSILAIFVVQGIAIGLIGTLAGLALGTLISINLETLVHGLEKLLDTRFLDAKVYFMSDLPAQVIWADVLKICSTAFGLCCLSTLYPAWRAARTQPAQSLRHD